MKYDYDIFFRNDIFKFELIWIKINIKKNYLKIIILNVFVLNLFYISGEYLFVLFIDFKRYI